MSSIDTANLPSKATATPKPGPVVVLRRPLIDIVLTGFGVLALVVLAVAGGLLSWGHNFASK